jgi:transposase
MRPVISPRPGAGSASRESDQIDALAIARAVVKDGVDAFPVAYLDEQAMEIRLLLDHRPDLVAERTRTANRLRWHLVILCPDGQTRSGSS